MTPIRATQSAEAAWTVADFEEALLNRPAGEKWELIGGSIVKSMTGGTANHSLIVGNAYAHLRDAVHRTRPGCRVFMDFGLDTGDSLFFPDVMVTCEPIRPTDLKAKSPLFVVEVLSRATRTVDLVDKQLAYLRLPGLAAYLVLEQARPGGMLFRRTDADTWSIGEVDPAGRLSLPDLGLDLAVVDLYAGLD